MRQRVRDCHRDEHGFTLIELLVVIAIIGALAAIALPSFLGQKSKAHDGAAKAQARTAETAAETYSTDHNGEYTGMSVAELQALESSLNDKSAAELIAAKAFKGGGYEVVSQSLSTGDTFKIERSASGEVSRSCTETGKGGCPSSGAW